MFLLNLFALFLTCQSAQTTMAASVEGIYPTCVADAGRMQACASEPRFAAPTTLDHIGRIMAPVYVDGRGPFRFVIDTGASRSTISPALATRLGLDSASSPTVWLSGVTGSARVPTVMLKELRAGGIAFDSGHLPVIWSSVMADADGILGVAGLHEHRVHVDFERDHVEIAPSRGQKRKYREIRVPAQIVRGGLLAIQARVGSVRAMAVIDTGAERSLGNRKLLTALRKRRQTRHASAATPVEGATGEISYGYAAVAPPINFDKIDFQQVILTYGDFHIFDVWGLSDEPALLIGMDVLGSVKSIVFDYRLRELHIRI